jgi:hypothetical protein
LRAHSEIIVAAGANVMPLLKQRDDLLLRGFDLAGVANLHVDVAQRSAADHAFHRTGIRHNDDVVLIHALRAQAFRREHAKNRERHVLNPQNLADRIFVAVNLRRCRAANHANLVRAAHILRRKRHAVGQRPLTNIEVIR